MPRDDSDLDSISTASCSDDEEIDDEAMRRLNCNFLQKKKSGKFQEIIAQRKASFVMAKTLSQMFSQSDKKKPSEPPASSAGTTGGRTGRGFAQVASEVAASSGSSTSFHHQIPQPPSSAVSRVPTTSSTGRSRVVGFGAHGDSPHSSHAEEEETTTGPSPPTAPTDAAVTSSADAAGSPLPSTDSRGISWSNAGEAVAAASTSTTSPTTTISTPPRIEGYHPSPPSATRRSSNDPSPAGASEAHGSNAQYGTVDTVTQGSRDDSGYGRYATRRSSNDPSPAGASEAHGSHAQHGTVDTVTQGSHDCDDQLAPSTSLALRQPETLECLTADGSSQPQTSEETSTTAATTSTTTAAAAQRKMSTLLSLGGLVTAISAVPRLMSLGGITLGRPVAPVEVPDTERRTMLPIGGLAGPSSSSSASLAGVSPSLAMKRMLASPQKILFALPDAHSNRLLGGGDSEDHSRSRHHSDCEDSLCDDKQDHTNKEEIDTSSSHGRPRGESGGAIMALEAEPTLSPSEAVVVNNVLSAFGAGGLLKIGKAAAGTHPQMSSTRIGANHASGPHTGSAPTTPTPRNSPRSQFDGGDDTRHPSTQPAAVVNKNWSKAAFLVGERRKAPDTNGLFGDDDGISASGGEGEGSDREAIIKREKALQDRMKALKNLVGPTSISLGGGGVPLSARAPSKSPRTNLVPLSGRR